MGVRDAGLADEYTDHREGLQICRLRQEEKILTRKLWERAFPEDSLRFVDYYYSNKCKDNEVWALKQGAGIHSMLQLNPYEFFIRSFTGLETVPLFYLVGVATEKEYRHRGYMKRLFCRVLQEMEEREQPFTFLMPANPDIYRPFGFRYIYAMETFQVISRQRQVLKAMALEAKDDLLRWEPASSNHLKELAGFSKEYLERHYRLGTKRDEAYFRRWLLELKSQEGAILVLRGRNGIKGYYAYGRDEGEAKIQEAFFSGEAAVVREASRFLQKNADRQPVIMARLLSLKGMQRFICAKGRFEVCLELEDPVIEKNRGLFYLRGDAKGSRFERLESGRADLKLGIGAFTELLFGYKEVDVWQKENRVVLNENTSSFLHNLLPLSPLHINEIV